MGQEPAGVRAATDSQAFSDWAVGAALIAFASLCATASGIYILNDLLDLSARPESPSQMQASIRKWCGAPSPRAAVIGRVFSLGLGLAVAIKVTPLILLYAAISHCLLAGAKTVSTHRCVYSGSALYTAHRCRWRRFSDHPVTLWLLAFSVFTFLSLALIKRCGELPRDPERPASSLGSNRRGYLPSDRPLLMTIGVASAFASSVVLALFVGALTASTKLYRSPELLWGLVSVSTVLAVPSLA